ncbi:TetR/AcrR family transcriptional regulator [Vallitalea guaymasensis]|uniref:TetR/AcrR family transcriptional regulator n=1 Tax=Vallitalea guaymasensis TaxID=1185412 RepID=A0A8J8M8R8_9FIRM|nr:TetR/AcrR family transcriptional regulator [Vallitalea guaymasensis]QUH28444.1 TetR/AcrR family transcriptional regulator [Vallitalea guaymasensis]
MPSNTYYNLPTTKKDKIFNIALEEFTKNNYNDASITRMVETLKIAKGSIYQYFNNKKDLYFYLIEQASNKKLEYISSNVKFEISDFIELYKQILKIGTKFDIEYPTYSIFLSKVFSGNHDPFKNETIDSMKLMSDNYIKNLIIQARDNGQIRKDIDIELIAFFLTEITTNIGRYIMKKNGISQEKLVSNIKNDTLNIQIEKALDDTLELIKKGILA